ncbi:MAG: SnoaL-like domain protein [Thermomicrobiales bacterium]|jgi:ketosteroid isomerase-like protein|nr:SnoaL-like domain protein [Thermomicrobiales bacterium]
MNAITTDSRTTVVTHCISRRTALRGLGGGGLAAALAFGAPIRAGASSEDRIARALFGPMSDDDPAAVIEAYLSAVNAGDLEAILDLYADDAVHIFLPTPDGSAGVCLGKANFRMWYEQSLANGDRVELEEGTLAVDGNQATFFCQIRSEPWRKLGVEALEAKTDLVVIDGRIATHLVTLTPASVRTLQAARGATADLAMGSVAPLLPSERRGSGEPY